MSSNKLLITEPVLDRLGDDWSVEDKPKFPINEKTQVLTLSEVALLIERRIKVNIEANDKSEDKVDIDNDLQAVPKMTAAVYDYCRQFGKDRTVEECEKTRMSFTGLSYITEIEGAMLANLQIEDYEEALLEFPTVAKIGLLPEVSANIKR